MPFVVKANQLRLGRMACAHLRPRLPYLARRRPDAAPRSDSRSTLTMNKVISADQAARLVCDMDIVRFIMWSGLGCPDKVLDALGNLFAAEGRPRGLTT